MKNRQWLLARRPDGAIKDSDFNFVETEAPIPGEGQVLVRNTMLSCDPTQRGWIAFDTYLPAVKIGEVVRSIGAGRIVASNHPDFAVGDIVSGPCRLAGLRRHEPQGPTQQAAAGDAARTRDERVRRDRNHRLFRSPRRRPAGRGRNGGRLGRGRGDGLGRRADRQDQRLPRNRHRRRGREVPLADRRGRLRRGDRLQVGERSGAAEGTLSQGHRHLLRQCRRRPFSMRRWRGLRCEGAWCFAAGSRTTTRQNRRRDPRTTSTWSSSADAWRASSCSITCRARAKRSAALAGWMQAGKLKTKVDVQDGLENAPATLRRLFEGRNDGKQLLRIAE